jgi:hypothetical protein
MGQPIATPTPVLTVDPGSLPGTYQIQLVVHDTFGQTSAPFVTSVRVMSPIITITSPTPIVLQPQIVTPPHVPPPPPDP